MVTDVENSLTLGAEAKVRGNNKDIFEARKQGLISRFRSQLGLLIDKQKSGGPGTSNDCNIARLSFLTGCKMNCFPPILAALFVLLSHTDYAVGDCNGKKSDINLVHLDNTWVQNLLANGYQLHPGVGYYKLYKTLVTWQDAWKKCEDDGAHLLILNSEAEAELARKIISPHSDHSAFHVGVHDLFVEGRYITIQDENLNSSGYNKWATGQPDNWHGDENCVVIHRNALLADVNCTWKFWFICEHEPYKLSVAF
ncbi:hemolymph lipopolysaccharide-binding protein-like [Periplaneta americana]|uniref:hemolymph lipopolysaccharide-binding protein-like n=1 Tax=Periplaneta americana TaxID=6978 RepID=UPI0037E8BEE5